MDSKEIFDLLKYGEHIHLECKKAETKLPNSVWETYCSGLEAMGLSTYLEVRGVTEILE